MKRLYSVTNRDILSYETLARITNPPIKSYLCFTVKARKGQGRDKQRTLTVNTSPLLGLLGVINPTTPTHLSKQCGSPPVCDFKTVVKAQGTAGTGAFTLKDLL